MPTPAPPIDRVRSRMTPRACLWTLIGVSTLLRLVWAMGLGPAIDEPYYIQYVRHLDWSYFDHPPMVAVVGLPGLAMAGDPYSLIGLRAGFLAMFAGSTWLIARLTSRYYGPRAGVLAALALNATGFFGMAVGTIALPDGPLLFFWLLTLERLSVALDEPDRLGPWLALGVAWGGAILSKYYAALLPVGALIYLILRPHARRCLRRPGPYLAVLIGAAMFAPVVVWNARHGWTSFLFQGGRASGSAGLRLDHLLVAIGSEALYLFPWLFVLLVMILFRLLRRGPRSWDDGEAFLMSQAMPALVVFHAVASIQRIMPYWPLSGFVALMPLLGRFWGERLIARPTFYRRGLVVVAATPIVLGALVVLQARTGLIAPGWNDPTVELFAWDQVAEEIERRGLIDGPGTFLFAESWDRAAKLALATRDRVPVTCYNIEPRSYALWSRPEDWVGRDGIFVEDGRRPGQLANYTRFFRKYEPIEPIRITRRGQVVREITLYRGTFQTWPFPFDGRYHQVAQKPTADPARLR